MNKCKEVANIAAFFYDITSYINKYYTFFYFEIFSEKTYIHYYEFDV